jgi:hypothetical protein
LRLFGNMNGHELVLMIFFGLAPFLVPLPMMLMGVLAAGEPTTNINFTVASSEAVLASIQFSLTNPPPLYANLTNVVILNTPTNGVASGAILLQPQTGDAGTRTITLVGAGYDGTNAVSGLANIQVTVQPGTEPVTRWKDPVDGNWSDAARWTDGVPSTSKAGVVDFPGNYTITMNADATVADDQHHLFAGSSQLGSDCHSDAMTDRRQGARVENLAWEACFQPL